MNTNLQALDEHFENLISEVKLTHRQFEEMLQRHATSMSNRSNKENQPVQGNRPVPILNLKQVDTSLRIEVQGKPKSMIEAGMSYYKPKTTPKPFKLKTGTRAQIRKAAGGSPGRVTPYPGEIKRPRSAGCSPAAQQAIKHTHPPGFHFGPTQPSIS